MKASKCLRLVLCIATLVTLSHGGRIEKRIKFGALKKLGMDTISSYKPNRDIVKNVLNPYKGIVTFFTYYIVKPF